jgi:hypothetical protein
MHQRLLRWVQHGLPRAELPFWGVWSSCGAAAKRHAKERQNAATVSFKGWLGEAPGASERVLGTLWPAVRTLWDTGQAIGPPAHQSTAGEPCTAGPSGAPWAVDGKPFLTLRVSGGHKLPSSKNAALPCPPPPAPHLPDQAPPAGRSATSPSPG